MTIKKFLSISIFLLSLFVLHSTLTTSVKAVTFQYPEYNVDVTVNKDSSMDVREKVIYKAFGEFHGLRRDLTLSNENRDRRCSTTNNLYCGGFDRVVVKSIQDLNGNDITNKINLYNVEDEDTNIESLRFEWEIYPNGENKNGEQFGWILNYTVYGGIIGVEGNPYFYWNMLPENRNGLVDNSTVTLKFPNDLTIRKNDLQVYSDINFNSNVIGNTATFKLSRLPSISGFTVSYKFDENEINLPGQIAYTLSPGYGSNIFLDNVDITDQVDGLIKSVSEGEHIVKFTHVGYETVERKVTVESGETEIIEVNLAPQGWMQILLLLNNLICICGCIFIPIGLLAVFFHYKKNGKDKDMPKTIIPLFTPPTNVAPYMVGSLIDESVDRQDVVGTIIDLAYRGYLKIKEVEKNKNYELTKLEGKKGDKGLNNVEQEIIDSLFSTGDIVETKDLGTTFPLTFIKIQNNIYKEMVSEGYFTKQPKTTIGLYLTLGIFMMIAGVVSFIIITALLVSFLGILTVFTPSLVLTVVGIAFIIAAKFMPAKTSTGSKVYADILGFKMFMNTADRYTVQNLDPEDFVKYLGYAIVFGIEKQWAKNFEGIYKGVPDWYEGSGNIYDAIWVSSFARNFSNSTVQSMTPITTSSSSGSGWSGGGSFGGFSGGGGGGGSSGGW